MQRWPPVAKEAVKAAGRMAYNAGEAAIGFYQNEWRWIIDQATNRWRESTPLETLISIPVLTAQDLIDPATGDTELLPVALHPRGSLERLNLRPETTALLKTFQVCQAPLLEPMVLRTPLRKLSLTSSRHSLLRTESTVVWTSG